MNLSGTQRPVMDVSAPRPSQSPASPVSSSSDQIAVRPAPLATAVTESPKAIEQQPQTQLTPAVAKAKPNIPSEPAKQRSGAPVGVITAAVLVMMVLSAAAVIVYATSQTA